MTPNFVGIALVVCVAVIILQQFWIAWISQNGFSKWDKTAHSYSKHRYYTLLFCCSMFLLVVGGSLVWILVEPDGGMANQYVRLLKESSLISVLGVGLLASIFRWLIDNRIERWDKLGKELSELDSSGVDDDSVFKRLRRLWNSNIWLVWFLCSYIVVSIVAFWSSDAINLAKTNSQLEMRAMASAIQERIKEPQLLQTDDLVQIRKSLETIRSNLLELARTGIEPTIETKNSSEKLEIALTSKKLWNQASSYIQKLEIKTLEAKKAAAEQSLAKAKVKVDAAVKDVVDAKDDPVKKKAAEELKKAADSELSEATKLQAETAKLAGIELTDLEIPPVSQGERSKHQTIPAVLIAVAIWSILWFSWYRWVYAHIHGLMREKHKFRGPAVNKFMKQKDCKIPRQVVVVGPKHSGKSELVEQLSRMPKEPDSKVPIFQQQDHNGTLLSLCDMPGENLGDQIAHAMRYRIDWLVVVLRGNAFLKTNGDPTVEETELKRDFGDLAKLPKVCSDEFHKEISVDKDGNETEQEFYDGEYTRDFFTALRLLLNQSDGNESAIFQNAKNWLLILNYADANEKNVATNVIGDDALGLLHGSIATLSSAELREDREHVVLSVVGGAPAVIGILVPSATEPEQLSPFKKWFTWTSKNSVNKDGV